MLKIFLGNMGGVIYHPPTYFDNQYEDEWITDPLTKEMVKDVDQSEVISSRLIDSPVLGTGFSKGIVRWCENPDPACI